MPHSPDKILNRVPPVSLTAENYVISYMLADFTLIGPIAEIITPEDFYQEKCRLVFSAILELDARGIQPTLAVLGDHLKEKGQIEMVGGYSWLADTQDLFTSPIGYKDDVEVVRDKSLTRKILTTAMQIAEQCYEDHESVDTFLDEVDGAFFNLSLKSSSHRVYTMDELTEIATERIQQQRDNKKDISGVPSGLRELDRQLGGFQPGDLIIVGARPSLGKSSLVSGWLDYASIHHKVPSLLFSLEMSKEQVAMRAISAEARVDNVKIRTGYLNDRDYEKIGRAIFDLRTAPIFVDDTGGNNLLSICSTAKRMKREKDIGIIAIDYIQLVRSQVGRREENRATELGNMTKRLKLLAKELSIPVIILSQLNRQVEMRQDKRPQYSDIKESGSMEEDADVVLLIYRDEFYHPDSEAGNTAEIIIGKNRNGPIGLVRAAFHKEYTRFDNLLTPGEIEEPQYETVEDF